MRLVEGVTTNKAERTFASLRAHIVRVSTSERTRFVVSARVSATNKDYGEFVGEADTLAAARQMLAEQIKFATSTGLEVRLDDGDEAPTDIPASAFWPDETPAGRIERLESDVAALAIERNLLRGRIEALEHNLAAGKAELVEAIGNKILHAANGREGLRVRINNAERRLRALEEIAAREVAS